MRSLRSPVPTCALRCAAYFAFSRAIFCSSNRERSTVNACCLFFCCDRPSAQRTIKPVGLCNTCTAESVVLTPCPPGPDARQTVISSSSGLSCTSTSSASGNTARSEEHTSELQSRLHLVCRLLLEKKKKNNRENRIL